MPATGVGGIGGAMDLAAGSARILVLMFHLTRDGEPKLVERCTYPLTAARLRPTVVTDLALIDVDRTASCCASSRPASRRRRPAGTAAPLRVASDVREMTFA